ncbi:MAG: FecR family protein [Bacteroidia bacterium]
MAHIPSFPHDAFLAKWLAGELSETEWNAWKVEAGEEELNRIIATVDQLEVPTSRTKAEAWEQFAAKLQDEQIFAAVDQWDVPAIRTKTEAWEQFAATLEEKNTETAKVRKMSPMRWVSSIAAAVIILLGVGYLLRDTTVNYNTQVGEKLSVLLPDNSEVILNANSSLSFDPDSWDEKRFVTLDGEAYFEVEKGQTFTVGTDQGTVSVLGTRFNVQDRPEKWSVQCYSGKVEVKAKTESIILTAGQSTELANKSLRPLTFEPNESQMWVNDFVAFEATPLNEVVVELERQYNIEVVWPSELDATKSYTGGFPHNDFDSALKMVFGPSNYLAKLEGGRKVYLSPK